MNDRDRILAGWHRLRTDQPDLYAPEIAEQLGVGHDQLRGVVQRARARDDPRAVPGRDTRFKPRRPPASVPAGWQWSDAQLFDLCTDDEGEQS